MAITPPTSRHKPNSGAASATRKVTVEEISTTSFPLNRSSSPTPPPDQPKKTFSEVNPDYFQLDLPSNFIPYQFKSVSACHLKGYHQSKFSRAAKEDKIRYVVEAIGSTLEDSVSAFELTPADFYFIMYWQRVNSYSSMPLITEALCETAEHLNKVYNGYKETEDGELKYLDEASLKNPLILKSTTLDVKQLSSLDLSEFEPIIHYLLGFETMRDVVDTTETLEKMVQKSLDNPKLDLDIEGYTWLAAKAAFLDKTGRSLDDRIEIVKKMTTAETNLLDKYIEVVTDYGVSDSTTFKCKECGGFTEIKFSINPLTFL